MEKKQLSFFEEAKKERRKIVISLDKIYLISIFFIIIIIVSFSLGVEKGKRINLRSYLINLNREEKKGQQIIDKALKLENAPKEKIESPRKKSNDEKLIFYSVQLASYTRKDIAESEANKLKKKGVEPILIKKGKYLVLCAGKFETKEEAKKLAKNLKIYYSDCFIRKL